MYALFFKWRLRPGKEEQFVRAWREMTEHIRADFGGLGSRLHRAEDGVVFAYAQWPSEAACKRERVLTPRMDELRALMRDAADLIEGPLGGEVLDDLLVK